MTKTLRAVLVTLALTALLPLTALAHADGGVDETFVAPDMNQASYWNARFGAGWSCTKFENHSGFIPEEYEAAVVHDGQLVRVYASIGGAFTALGPHNPNSPHGAHYAAPHSWVMKCNYVPVTTTTTTTLPEETTTTTVVTTTTTIDDTTTTTGATTTTTVDDTTTTTIGDSTTTTLPEETTTTIATSSTVVTVPTTDPPTDSTLPFTGIGSAGILSLIASALIAVGMALLWWKSRGATE